MAKKSTKATKGDTAPKAKKSVMNINAPQAMVDYYFTKISTNNGHKYLAMRAQGEVNGNSTPWDPPKVSSLSGRSLFGGNKRTISRRLITR